MHGDANRVIKMNLEDETNRYDAAPDNRLYWHPRIEFGLWIVDWIWVALCYAVVWQFFAGPELLSGILKSDSPPKDAFIAVEARAACIIVGLGLLFYVTKIIEFWYIFAVRHTWAQYSPPHRGILTVIKSVPFFLVLAPYLWFAIWVLEKISVNLIPDNTAIRSDLILKADESGWLHWLQSGVIFVLAVALCVGLFRLLFSSTRSLISHYTTATRQYGWLTTIKGVSIMFLMRLKQPRKDFFLQTPVVNNAMFFAASVVIFITLPGPGLNMLAAISLALYSASWSLDLVAPPTWLFLGASAYESAFVFHDLRRKWLPRLGVTLLHRYNPAWSAHYRYEAQVLWSKGVYAANFMNDPSTPRMWSLRTRDNLWQHAVLVLMDFVVVIVIDARIVREGLQEELDWLFKSGRLEKTWILGLEDKTAPAIFAALADEPDADQKIGALMDRVVSGHKLYAASWIENGLRLQTVPPS